MTNPQKPQAKVVTDIRSEGLEFYMVLQYVAYFYKDVMKAQARHDSPDTLIKYSRDREYPWVLMTSKVRPGQKVLDCGSGYSPLPFIWAKFGSEVHAMDKDTKVCTGPQFILSELREKGIRQFLRLSVFDKYYIRRLWQPDFWGPVPPKLLKTYGVNYYNGDFTKLSYGDGHFDLVTCVSVLEHMTPDDRTRGIKEMARVVKKGGKFIITYDKFKDDLTDDFIKESGMTPAEIVRFIQPDNLYEEGMPEIVGICLVK